MATVLVVEDETVVLTLAESVLEHAGYDTISAATPAEAEAILRSDRSLDVVATDIGLGEELERAARRDAFIVPGLGDAGDRTYGTK